MNYNISYQKKSVKNNKIKKVTKIIKKKYKFFEKKFDSIKNLNI